MIETTRTKVSKSPLMIAMGIRDTVPVTWETVTPGKIPAMETTLMKPALAAKIEPPRTMALNSDGGRLFIKDEILFGRAEI